jgi:hypothetical protein
MTDYKATPEQWEVQEKFAPESEDACCLLELRARVEILEACMYQFRCDHLRLANTCASMAPDRSKFFANLMSDEELRANVETLEAAAHKHIVETSANILALASRVEALESTQQQPEPINEEENNRRFHACMDLIRNATPEQIRSAAELPKRPASKVYEINEPLKLTPEQAQQIRDLLAPEPRRNHPAKPDSLLVERVGAAIFEQFENNAGNEAEARAAIREVALWLNEAPLDLYPGDRGIVVNTLYDQANQ